jgi:hypothetical protein
VLTWQGLTRDAGPGGMLLGLVVVGLVASGRMTWLGFCWR